MTLPTPQAVEEAKEALNKVLHLFQMDARTNDGLRDSIAVLESLPELRQKAEEILTLHDAAMKSVSKCEKWDHIMLQHPKMRELLDAVVSAAQKLTPPTK